MGAGKTSVGRSLSQLLNWEFEDLDDRIERNEGRTVNEIFRTLGEPAFRHAEKAALRQVLNDLERGSNRVVALGGGAFVQKANAAALKAAAIPTVFLDADVDALWRRCQEQAGRQGTSRPLLSSLEEFAALHQKRHQAYLAASVRIDTGRRKVEEISAEIAETLSLKP